MSWRSRGNHLRPFYESQSLVVKLVDPVLSYDSDEKSWRKTRTQRGEFEKPLHFSVHDDGPFQAAVRYHVNGNHTIYCSQSTVNECCTAYARIIMIPFHVCYPSHLPPHFSESEPSALHHWASATAPDSGLTVDPAEPHHHHCTVAYPLEPKHGKHPPPLPLLTA